MKRIFLITISLLFSIVTFSQQKKQIKVITKQEKLFTQKKENPLYIVNNTFISKEEMSKINPDDIKSINVLKGDKAVGLYGEKGKNGVVAITMKTKKEKLEDKKSKK